MSPAKNICSGINTSKLVLKSVCHGGKQVKDKIVITVQTYWFKQKIFLLVQKYFSKCTKIDYLRSQRYCEIDWEFEICIQCKQCQGQTARPGATFPTLSEKCVGSLTSLLTISEKRKEEGPTAYLPSPRRLECFISNHCQSKGSKFSSIILRHWVFTRSGVRRSTTRVSQARIVKISKVDSISLVMINFLFVFLIICRLLCWTWCFVKCCWRLRRMCLWPTRSL